MYLGHFLVHTEYDISELSFDTIHNLSESSVPDLEKFHYFAKNLVVFECFGKFCMLWDKFLLLLMAKYWNNTLDIWSHLKKDQVLELLSAF